MDIFKKHRNHVDLLVLKRSDYETRNLKSPSSDAPSLPSPNADFDSLREELEETKAKEQSLIVENLNLMEQKIELQQQVIYSKF